MSNVKDKIFSYLGFAKKAGKMKAGVNAVATLKGRVPLIVLCDSASENTKKDALSLAKKYRSALVLSVGYTVEELINKENCKVVAVTDGPMSPLCEVADACLAVTDESLANAIINTVKQEKDGKFVFLEA